MGWQTTSKGSRAGLQRQAVPEPSDRLLQVCARITNEPSDWLGKPHHEPSILFFGASEFVYSPIQSGNPPSRPSGAKPAVSYTEAWQWVFFFPKTPPGEYPILGSQCCTYWKTRKICLDQDTLVTKAKRKEGPSRPP